jgi:cyclopropane fatty-acyl-phospholipid synthase-like methyltransferase
LTRQKSLSRKYFEELYASSPDPWNFTDSQYERNKYQTTLEAINSDYRSGLEIGCSIGVFTQTLAARCSRLLAVDISEKALEQARERCAHLSQVEFQRLALPREFPNGSFDLIVLSEVGYYWTVSDLDRFICWVSSVLWPGGLCTLVHWTGETDYPMTGDAVHDHFLEATEGFLRPRLSVRHQSYRLDALTRF